MHLWWSRQLDFSVANLETLNYFRQLHSSHAVCPEWSFSIIFQNEGQHLSDCYLIIISVASMSVMASQIARNSTIYSTAFSDFEQKISKNNSALLALCPPILSESVSYRPHNYGIPMRYQWTKYDFSTCDVQKINGCTDWLDGLLIPRICKHMMTSSNGNIFRVTGPLCGEFTGPGEFPTQRPVTRSFDVYFDLRPNKRLSKQPWGWWFDTLSCSLWRHRNEYLSLIWLWHYQFDVLTRNEFLRLLCMIDHICVKHKHLY